MWPWSRSLGGKGGWGGHTFQALSCSGRTNIEIVQEESPPSEVLQNEGGE